MAIMGRNYFRHYSFQSEFGQIKVPHEPFHPSRLYRPPPDAHLSFPAPVQAPTIESTENCPTRPRRQRRSGIMKEFFRGWRRKVGVVTLIMALVLMVGWVRSFHLWDSVSVPTKYNGNIHTFTSREGNLSWGRSFDTNGADACRNASFRFNSTPAQSLKLVSVAHLDEWRFACGGFDFFKRDFPNQTLICWRFPYWSFVLPLTALSAYLLLTKPRQSNQKKIDEPIPDERGGAAS